MIDGYTKADPPTQKKLPVEADVPELLIEMGYGKSGSIQLQAVGDLSLIAFYYLLRIGEYTVNSLTAMVAYLRPLFFRASC
jgi:hypothetical protein